MTTTISVIVVGFGSQSGLGECLGAIEGQLRPGDELLLVDNGLTKLPELGMARVVTAGANLGFGGGCRLGAASTTGDVLLFVNSDAVVQPSALDVLRRAAVEPDTGLVTGCVVLSDRVNTINAAGNPVHYLGISWAGSHGEPVSEHPHPDDVASVSGALFATRREVWNRLGGMDDGYFLYHEDTDLSLRCRLAGLRVVYRPDAIATHDYEFSRNAEKMYLLERNRLRTVLTTYPRGLLARVLPMLLITEPMMLALACARGFGGEKVRSWWWLIAHARMVAQRRRAVQGESTVDWTTLARVLQPRIEQRVTEAPVGIRLLNSILAAYWHAVTRRALTGGNS